MGVRVRQKGTKWYVFINHKRQRKAVCVGTSKQAADKVRDRLEAELGVGNRGILTRQSLAPTFADYAQHWLEDSVALRCKVSSQRIMRSVVRIHLVPAFGRQRLDQITRAQVRSFLADKARQYSRGYALRVTKVLGTILAHAVEEELLSTNVATKLGKFLPEGQAGRNITPFTSRELVHYLRAMYAHYPQHYAYFLTLARTGMREGEALGLTWEDIQFGTGPDDPHRSIHVRRTWDGKHQCYHTPKTGKTRRIDMSKELRSVLLTAYNDRMDAAHLQGRTDIAPVVFAGPSGRPYAQPSLHAVHKRVCGYAGLRTNRIHDLRHSYATILLYEHHAPIQYVSEQLGHASIKMTVDVYGHPTPGTNIRLVDQLDTRRGHGTVRA